MVDTHSFSRKRILDGAAFRSHIFDLHDCFLHIMRTRAVARMYAQPSASCNTLFCCIVRLPRFNNRNRRAVKSAATAASTSSVQAVVNQCQSQHMRNRDPFAVYNLHSALMNKLLLRPCQPLFLRHGQMPCHPKLVPTVTAAVSPPGTTIGSLQADARYLSPT